jgi:hypothetical protein
LVTFWPELFDRQRAEHCFEKADVDGARPADPFQWITRIATSGEEINETQSKQHLGSIVTALTAQSGVLTLLFLPRTSVDPY